jgi:competence protein ComEC
LDERLEKHLPEEKVQRFSNPISEYLLFTLAAQVTTLPVIAIHFGRISLSSLLANPLILPVQPPILILGGISTIAGMIFPWLGKVIALLVWVPMRYTNFVVEMLAKIKGASLAVHPRIAVLILLTLAVFVILFGFRNYFKKIFSKWFTWIVFLLILASAAAWSIFAYIPDGKLYIHLVENGDDSTLVLRDPQGKVIMFDPGKSVNELSAEVSRQLSPWDFSIDEVWLTHRASVSNLELFQERIPITKAVLTPAIYLAGADQRPVRVPQNIELVKLASGGERIYPSGMVIRLAGEDQGRSALFIEYGRMRILLPNGVDYALLREASPGMLDDLTMLILQEEDISYIPPRVWQALEPQLILWNSTALSPEATWLGNDTYRRISISTDGKDFWVESE